MEPHGSGWLALWSLSDWLGEWAHRQSSEAPWAVLWDQNSVHSRWNGIEGPGPRRSLAPVTGTPVSLELWSRRVSGGLWWTRLCVRVGILRMHTIQMQPSEHSLLWGGYRQVMG